MNTRRSLKELLAKATPLRSGDVLAGVAAATEEERVRAQIELADVPLTRFLNEAVIPYEDDEVTRLIMDGHDEAAFAPVKSFTVGELRDWLLTDAADTAALTALAPGVTPEMAAAVSKLMRMQDLVLVAKKCEVVTRFRNTIGLPGTFSVRLQPNHPTDDAKGIAASTLDGLMYGCGDAVIGINPATDNLENITRLLEMLDAIIQRHGIPTQTCVLTHVTTTMEAIENGAPVDLCFQSIAGTEAANASFGVTLDLLARAHEATLALKRGTVGTNCMYFETGQGSALSANAHHGVDQQTVEARAYAVARAFDPLLVNTVVGFIGPEYLYNGKQIMRAGLQAPGPAHGRGHLLHQPRRGRPGRHGRAVDLARRGGLQFHHGRARGGRHHAQLPVHLVPRRGLHPPPAGADARAGIPGLAGVPGHPRHQGTAPARERDQQPAGPEGRALSQRNRT